MYRVVTTLLEPYTFFWLLTVLAVARLWQKRRETRSRLACLTIVAAAWALVSVPAVSYLALGSLEWQYPAGQEQPEDAEVIVVLAGGVLPAGPGRPQPELDTDTVGRCLHAAALYRQGKPCPILLSGGKADLGSGYPVAARVMRSFLLRLGVAEANLLLEEQSRTTYENAVECSWLLSRCGFRRVVLVTDPMHMPRALACFRKQGIEGVSSPCNGRANGMSGLLLALLPRAGAGQPPSRPRVAGPGLVSAAGKDLVKCCPGWPHGAASPGTGCCGAHPLVQRTKGHGAFSLSETAPSRSPTPASPT
jgi:uncharacterized SAM-binding protein YcdF (DUF218 family)